MPNTTPLTARPTTYKGVQMRSRLEARYAQWLDSVNIDWKYEPQCFASERGQYLPDFELPYVRVMGAQRRVFVEVKPNMDFADEPIEAAYRWHDIIRESIDDAVLVLDVASLSRPIVMMPILGDRHSFGASWVLSHGMMLAPVVESDGWRE